MKEHSLPRRIAALCAVSAVAVMGIAGCSSDGDDSGGVDQSVLGSENKATGEPLTIAFNPGYLLDGLSAMGASSVDFGFTTPSRPAPPPAGPADSARCRRTTRRGRPRRRRSWRGPRSACGRPRSSRTTPRRRG